ncbi:hypothetical protein [Intestinibacter sp.]|uniref:hypothetical protein n=1 Tax=Intestinibacter sp. TaxID=1965304 RepID=UPI003F13539D
MFDLGRTSYYNLGLKKYTFNLETSNNCIVDNYVETVSPNVFAFEASANSNYDSGAFAQINKEGESDMLANVWAMRYPTSDNPLGW